MAFAPLLVSFAVVWSCVAIDEQSAVVWTEERIRQQLQGLAQPEFSGSLAQLIASRTFGTNDKLLLTGWLAQVYGGEQEETYLGALLDFLTSGYVLDYGIDVHDYATSAALLHAIFNAALDDDSVVTNSYWYNAIQYYQGLQPNDGPPTTQKLTFTLELARLFAALDLESISAEPQLSQALGSIIDYIQKDFAFKPFLEQLSVGHLVSRSELLSDLLAAVSFTCQDPELVDNIALVTPYIGFD